MKNNVKIQFINLNTLLSLNNTSQIQTSLDLLRLPSFVILQALIKLELKT